MLAKSHSKVAILGGDLKSGWKRLTTGKKGYTTSSQQIVDKFGDRTISSITVCRSPVSVGFVVKTFDLIKDKPYKDLFSVSPLENWLKALTLMNFYEKENVEIADKKQFDSFKDWCKKCGIE